MKLYIWVVVLFISTTAFAGDNVPKHNEKDRKSTDPFEIIKIIPTTPVRDQYNTSTCWSFSTISFLESELMRTGKGEYNLSEMYVVHCDYERKAEKYIRLHGKLNFSPGGEPNDVTDAIADFGIVPESVYQGMKNDSDNHLQSEMDQVLEAYMEKILSASTNELIPDWETGYNAILDAYMGKLPTTFSYKGKEYTPKSFADSLGINPKNYILITSFMYKPYYKPFIMEIPDNWSWGVSYNVPLDAMIEVMDSTLYKGYSLVWSTDVTEKGFSFDKGMAVAPKIVYEPDSVKEKKKWNRESMEEQDKYMFSMEHPVPELVVTPQIRQKAFDDYSTTDDHGMHIVGLATDKTGKKYYYVKNSWGTGNSRNGYLFASEAYVRYKTISIMVNKNALPQEIRKKLGL